MSQSLDEMINTLADKVGQEASDKAKAAFKATAYEKIQLILMQPVVATTAPPVASPIIPEPVTAIPIPTVPQQAATPKPETNTDAITEYLKKKDEIPAPKKSKLNFDKTRIALVAGIITLAVLALVFGGALGQTTGPSLTASPNNSNIIQVTGIGFNASTPVELYLTQNNTLASTFNTSVSTNGSGAFSTIYIIPTSLEGSFTLTATTGSLTAQTQITVPNLKGTDGLNGAKGESFNATGNILLYNGTQGTQGERGAQGYMGNSTAGLVAVGLSIAALVIVVYPKKKTQMAL